MCVQYRTIVSFFLHIEAQHALLLVWYKLTLSCDETLSGVSAKWCDKSMFSIVWQSGNTVTSIGSGKEGFSPYTDSAPLCFFWTWTFEPCDPALPYLSKAGTALYVIHEVQRLLCTSLLQTESLMKTEQMKLWDWRTPNSCFLSLKSGL